MLREATAEISSNLIQGCSATSQGKVGRSRTFSIAGDNNDANEHAEDVDRDGSTFGVGAKDCLLTQKKAMVDVVLNISVSASAALVVQNCIERGDDRCNGNSRWHAPTRNVGQIIDNGWNEVGRENIRGRVGSQGRDC